MDELKKESNEETDTPGCAYCNGCGKEYPLLDFHDIIVKGRPLIVCTACKGDEP